MKLHELVITGNLSGADIPQRVFGKVMRRKNLEDMAKFKCPKCGHLCKPGTKKCPKCGAKC